MALPLQGWGAVKGVAVGIDLSPLCDQIVRNALAVSAPHDAEVVLIHVAAPDPDFVGMDAGPQSIRDYVYIPLGGSRVSSWGTRASLAVATRVSGLWHGAAWTFVSGLTIAPGGLVLFCLAAVVVDHLAGWVEERRPGAGERVPLVLRGASFVFLGVFDWHAMPREANPFIDFQF